MTGHSDMQQRFRDAFFGISRLLAGRNGTDKLSIFLFILSLIINMVNSFIRAWQPSLLLSALSFTLFAFAVFRTFSKNIQKRRLENFKFENLLKLLYLDKLLSKIVYSAKNFSLRIRYFKTHRFRTCPNCKKLLRLTKKRGKREFSCPTCGHKVKVRIWL